jgi:hypothetical protein
MCWFSTDYQDKIEEAKAGERLGIRQMHWGGNWVVRETELQTSHPCPVCLKDGSRVVFRFSEDQQASLHFGPESEAVFRMLTRPKRDVFEFTDGIRSRLNDLPAGLIFDVLVVPGSEQVSAVLNVEQPADNDEEPKKEPLLARLLPHF